MIKDGPQTQSLDPDLRNSGMLGSEVSIWSVLERGVNHEDCILIPKFGVVGFRGFGSGPSLAMRFAVSVMVLKWKMQMLLCGAKIPGSTFNLLLRFPWEMFYCLSLVTPI